MMRWVFILIAGSLAAHSAETFYVSRDGGGDGSATNNALSLAWLNDSANWGSGAAKISGGDTVRLFGAFTNELVIAGSGGISAPVRIIFETNATFTWGKWATAGAIQFGGQSNIIVDGGFCCTQPVPQIQNTNNGTGLAQSNDSRGIGGSQSGTGPIFDSILCNLRITNIYRKVQGQIDVMRKGYGIDLSGSSIIVSNCAISDCDAGLGYGANAVFQKDIYWISNTVLNCNHAMSLGLGDSNTYTSNFVIAGNLFDKWIVWDAPGDTPIHLDGLIMFNNAFDVSSIMQKLKIVGNRFGKYVGTRTTAGIFFNSGGLVNDVLIANNLFECQVTNGWGNGFVAGGGSNVWCVNNTAIGDKDPVDGAAYGGTFRWGAVRGSKAYLYNNILRSGSGFTLLGHTTNAASSSTADTNNSLIVSNYFSDTWSDYNIIPFDNLNAAAFSFILMDNQGNTLWSPQINPEGAGLLNWQTFYNGAHPLTRVWALTHCDPNSKTNYPAFNSGTYVPASADTVARASGTNLTAIFAAFDTPAVDFNGNARAATGSWDIGAFVSTNAAEPSAITIRSGGSVRSGGNTR